MRFIFLFSTSTLTGPAAQSFNIIRYLVRNNHKVWVISDQKRDGDLNGFIESAGAKLIRNASISNKNKFLGKIEEIRDLRSIVMDFRPDFVVSSFSNDHFLIGLAERKIDYRFKLIRFFHSNSVRNDTFHRRLFENTDAFILFDYDIYLKFKKRFRGLTDRLYLFPTSIDTDLFRPGDNLECKKSFGLGENAFVVGYVGMFQKGRRHRELIDAFVRFRISNENARLIMVGGGETLDDIKRYSSKKVFSSDIVFTGFVDNDTLVSAYNSMDIFVLLSGGHDSSLRMLYEAQACGTYVLSYDNYQIRRLIETTDYGGVLSDIKPESVSKNIEIFKESEKSIDRKEIHDRISYEFNIDRAGESFIKVCNSILNRK